MPKLKHRPLCPAAVKMAERVLLVSGLSPEAVGRVFEAAARADGGHSDPVMEDALRRLATASPSVPVARIAAAFGFDRGMVYHRLEKLGLRAKKKRLGEDFHGERWKAVPGTDLTVSSLGRVRNHKGWLLTPEVLNDRPRVRSRGRMITIASAVLAAFRDTDLKRPAKHLNGDMRDCRLENLRPDRMRHRAEVHGGDHPWTRAEDMRLRRVETYAEAVEATGHTGRHVRARMKELGLRIETNLGGGRRALIDRDMAAVTKAMRALEAGAISDRAINLGLGVTMLTHQAKPEVQDAISSCMLALDDAGFTPAEIREAMGWSSRTLAKYREKVGLAPEKEGPVHAEEAPDGEVWKPIPGRQGMVSNFGRVSGARGHILKTRPHHSGGQQVGLTRDDDGRKALHKVAALVAAAFKPEIPAKQIAYINGDQNDARAENLVPRKALVWLREAVATADDRRAGNVIASGSEASRLRQYVVWREADAACPAGLDPDLRQDLISDMVVMMLNGRARDARTAFKLARTAHNRMMGTHRERSLDAPVGTSDLLLIDTLSDAAERF